MRGQMVAAWTYVGDINMIATERDLGTHVIEGRVGLGRSEEAAVQAC